MALSLKEQQELAELEELDALEKQYGQATPASSSSPSMPAPALVKRPEDMTPEEIAEADRLIQVEQGGRELAAYGAGTAQGASLGFSDELGAGLDVAKDTLTGNPTAKKWREYQKSRESANKALQEESPMAYMGGELTGGLAGAAVMPSIGGARIASMGSRIAPGVGKFLAGESGNLVSRLAGKAVTGGLEGIPIGAGYGLGSSEADISKPLELAADMGSGATMGLIGGAAISGSVQTGREGLKAAGRFVDDTDFLRQLGVAYDYGKKGLNLGSSSVQDKISLIPGRRAEDLVNNIYKVDTMLGKQVGQALDQAQAAGVKINVDPAIQETSANIFKTLFVDSPTLAQILDPKSAKLLKTIAQREAGDLNPIEARALRDELYGLGDKLAGFNSDQANLAKSMGFKLAGALDSGLKDTIPSYQQAATHFESFRRLVPENIISKGSPSQYGKAYLGDLKNPELKLYESSKEMLKKAKLPGEAAIEGRETFEKLRRNLKELERINPEAVKSLGGSAEDVINKLKRQSDELAMIRQAQGFDPQEGPKGVLGGAISGLVTTGRGLSTSLANKAGQIAKVAGQTAPVQTSVRLFNATDDVLRQLAQKLKGSEATSQMGDVLENALNNKNEVGKNAVLFKLMQNPDYRNLLKDEQSDGQ